MTRSLEGKVAVVTGGGSGIGRGIARRLAEDKAAIAVWDLNPEGAAETVRMIEDEGGKALALTADCADKAAIQAAAQETRSKLGPITILVNNAGIAPFTPFMDIGEDEFDKVIRINLKGPWLVTKEIVPDMLAAQWGRIINITSSSTQSGSFAQSHYVSSKGGLLGMTKALAMELGGTGITANMIPPGSIDTPMLRAHGDAIIPPLAARAALGRVGTPQDIAATAVWLCTDEARFITGQSLLVDGGFTIPGPR